MLDFVELTFELLDDNNQVINYLNEKEIFYIFSGNLLTIKLDRLDNLSMENIARIVKEINKLLVGK